jgi:DNA (cytosine-5)-methyltransferase 1
VGKGCELLLSLFCGAGGLDLGFEEAGFEVGLAFDKKLDSVNSYNRNRTGPDKSHCRDIRGIGLAELDLLWGGPFRPIGVVGGPPCQSFSQANRNATDDDPRHTLPLVYANLLKALNDRSPIKFFAMENVPGLSSSSHLHRLEELEDALEGAGFVVTRTILDARDFQTPQKRERLFLVGLNRDLFGDVAWTPPERTTKVGEDLTVASAIGGLPEPFFFEKGATPSRFPKHPNHWCMNPKSKKFTTEGALKPGDGRNRSFKTLAWDRPSPTVAYGNREVHVHPSGTRRLSVFEAMRLQGFPDKYELSGTLSSQIAQVSEAVPPPMAHAIALSILAAIEPPVNLSNTSQSSTDIGLCG